MLKLGKKKKTVVPKKVEEELEFSFPSLIDNVFNEGIKFNTDYFEIQTGVGQKKFGRSFFVKPSGYPRTVRINWLEGLFTGEDMDCSVDIQPFDRADAVRKLKNKIDELETVIISADKNDNRSKVEDSMQKLHDTKMLREQIRNNENGLYYVSITAAVYADTLSELNEKSVAIERRLSGDSIELVNAFDRQKEGWLTTLPLASNYLKRTHRNLDRMALTAMFPHKSSKLNHTGGMPIGVYGNEYVYFNNFDSKLNNYNLGIFGESGAGKGVLVKQIIARGFMDGIEKTVIMDVEPEYIALTHALGGIVISIRSDLTKEATSRINPLDIYVEKEIMHRYRPDEYIQERVNINEKVKEAIEFFKVMKESASPEESYLTAIELGALDDILQKEYRKRGITENPESLFEQLEEVSPNGEITFARHYLKMPQISDIKFEVDQRIDTGTKGLDKLSSVLSLFVAGKAFGMFDCQTEIYDGNGELLMDSALDEAPVVNFDISKLSKNGIERPLAQHVLNTWIWNRFVLNNPYPKKRIIQDEAWMMLQYPSMMEFWKTLSARGRKWNVSLTLVSQRYEMFNRTEAAQDVVTQLQSIAFMKQSDQDIEPILNTFRFADDVGEMIRNAEQGDVIFKAGKEIVFFQSQPTPSEWAFLNTNQNMSAETLMKKG
ncbi:VirB4 family type IV secretion system protein [Viridibacillus arvi]|uniref:VirB4 family type IV secretion system protein n=1 Tax=Viridibacillus arvi TaxID=263475 RepID=UPI0034CF4D50